MSQLKCCRSNQNDSKIKKTLKWIRLKIIEFIAYVYYLRLFIETHELFLLSSTAEIKIGDASTISALLSLIFAWIMLVVCIVLPCLAFYCFWCYRKQFDPDRKFVFMEFFADLKNNKFARLYSFALLTRRAGFIIVIVFWATEAQEFVFSFIIFVQVLYCICLGKFSS